jgi:hypothetical protein
MEAIVKLLPNKATLICLGLTCKSFYAMMKLKVQGKLDLWEDGPNWDGKHHCDCPRSLSCRYSGKLGRLLEDWFGAQYRLSYNLDSLQFLNIEIYGDAFDTYNPEERNLARRYDDYKQVVRDDRNLLPYPYYMGARWYGAAIEVITKDLQHFNEWQEWWKFWDDHCYVFRDSKNKVIFERMVDDFIRISGPRE